MPLTRIDSAFLDLDALGGIDFDVQSGVPTLSVDATTHRVGIGTATPGEELHIHASGTSYLKFTDEASGVGASDGAVFGLDHPHLYAWNYEDGDFVVATNATEKFRITSAGILLKSGQATLQTTSLPHPVQIAADSDAQNIACFGRASDDIGAIDFYEADKTTLLGELQYRRDHLNLRHRVGYISLATGGTTERLRISATGQIGMGKAGNVSPNGNSPLTIQESDSNSETICLRATNSGGNGSQPGIVMKTAANGHIGGIYCDVNSDYMRLSTSGSDVIYISDTGNVGIGYATPSQKLVVKGTTSLMATNSTNQWMAYTYTDNTFRLNYNGAGADEVVITSDGKLLIGSDTGSVHGNRLLQVGKTDRSETYVSIVSSTSGESGLLFADTTTNDTGGYRGQIRYHHSDDSMNFRTGAEERLRINANGDVNIGNKNHLSHHSTVDSLQVGYALNLYEDSYTNGTDNYVVLGNNVYYNNGNKYMRNDEASRIMMQAGTFYFQSAPSGTAGNAITFSDVLRITSTGNVGVGVVAPLSKFQVKTATNANIALSADGSEASIEAYNDAGSANVPLRIRGSEIKFKIDGTQRARLYYSSNSAVLALGDESNSAGHIRLEAKAAENQIHGRSNHPITFLINTGEKLKLHTTGLLEGKGAQFNSNITPTSGAGVEIFREGNGGGQIQAYDRGNSASLPMIIKGSTQSFYTSGSLRMHLNATGLGVNTSTITGGRLIHAHNTGTGSAYFQSTNSNSGDGSSSGALFGISGNNVYAPWSYHNGPIILATNSDPKVYIVSSGNVGVGTDNPLLKLDVRGGIQSVGSSISSPAQWISAVGNQSAYDNMKVWYTGYNSGSPRLYISPGTVPGSGTVNTYVHLQNITSSGAGTNRIGLKVDNNIEAGTYFGIANVGGSIAGSGGSENWIGTKTYGGDWALITKTHSATSSVIGNVGIGTTNPQSLLQLGSRTSATPQGALDVVRGEAIGGGTGPNIRLIHGPDSGTQRTHSIYSFIGDLRIFADASESLELSGANVKFKDGNRTERFSQSAGIFTGIATGDYFLTRPQYSNSFSLSGYTTTAGTLFTVIPAATLYGGLYIIGVTYSQNGGPYHHKAAATAYLSSKNSASANSNFTTGGIQHSHVGGSYLMEFSETPGSVHVVAGIRVKFNYALSTSGTLHVNAYRIAH